MRDLYGLRTDEFVTIFGAANVHAIPHTSSLYQKAFTSANGFTIPLGAEVNAISGEKAEYCSRAMGVTADEYTRITRYCFGDGVSKFVMTEHAAGQLYRFGLMPRLLGLSFAQAELLWRVMGEDTEAVLSTLGASRSLEPLWLFVRTERVLSWLMEAELDLVSLQAMVTRTFTATATAEMFNLLRNIYDSVRSDGSSRLPMDESLQEKLLRALGAGFALKRNVMAKVVGWLQAITSGTSAEFTLEQYWSDIESNVAADATLEGLQSHPRLPEHTQRLSQLALVALWLRLTEQDIELIVDHPASLVASWADVPTPSLSLLLVMWRLKRWQSELAASRDEGTRLIHLLPGLRSSDEAADLIAKVHAIHPETVLALIRAAALNTSGSATKEWPAAFDQLWYLLRWHRIGKELNVGATALATLYRMAQSDSDGEARDVLFAAARNLAAGLGTRIHEHVET
jgi:hypothetical protein